MCIPYSGILMRSGRILEDVYTHSHQIIKIKNKLDDNIDPRLLNWVAFEVSPDNNDYTTHVSGWTILKTIHYEDSRLPSWYSLEKYENKIRDAARKWQKKYVITKKSRLKHIIEPAYYMIYKNVVVENATNLLIGKNAKVVVRTPLNRLEIWDKASVSVQNIITYCTMYNESKAEFTYPVFNINMFNNSKARFYDHAKITANHDSECELYHDTIHAVLNERAKTKIAQAMQVILCDGSRIVEGKKNCEKVLDRTTWS